MDRKAWIVIILCSAGIVINAWFASQQAPLPPPAATAAVSPASKTAEPTATITAAPASPVSAPASAAPVETHTLTRGSVTWHFSSKGAGIEKVVLAGTDQIELNAHGHEPIGALRREATGNDAVAYQITAKTDKSITFEGTAPDGINVRKTYNLTEGENTDEHLISVSVTLTNTGATAHKSEEYYLYAGAANSMRPDEALKPSFFWNDAGNAAQKDTNSFGGGWFSTEQM
jgi:YidC/Oxa1 family membrane protein insertase